VVQRVDLAAADKVLTTALEELELRTKVTQALMALILMLEEVDQVAAVAVLDKLAKIQ